MAETTVTTFDATGAVISVETVQTPTVAPAVDLPELAANVAQLGDALDWLILESLGGF